MVYTILISVVFIAEMIITITLLQVLLKLDKTVLAINDNLVSLKPEIRDISELSRKISEQYVELSQDFVEKTKDISENFLLRNFSKLLVGLLVINLNFKFIKRIRKSKLAKTLAKGLMFIENMV